MLTSTRGALPSRALPRSPYKAPAAPGASASRPRASVAAAAAPSPSSPAAQVAADAAARAFQPPPHSGYHFDGSSRRFFEGWYFKVDLPRLEDDGGARGAGGAAAAAEGGGGGGSGGNPSSSSSSTDSIALIYSVEDPGDASSGVRGVGVQVMGPGDGYLCQFARDTRLFWADERRLALGACLRPPAPSPSSSSAPPPPPPRSMVPPGAFDASVREGFQASTTWHQGRIVADEGGASGAAMSTVRSAEWCFSVRPVQGWGGVGGSNGNGSGSGSATCTVASPFNLRSSSGSGGGGRPLATAGWLSALSVFEPHWQVLVADGLATGWVRWGGGGGESEGESGGGNIMSSSSGKDGDGGRVRHFVDAPFYAEKNWGGGFPSKWIWVQCNNFRGAPGVSVTAVGARRALLVPGAGGTAAAGPSSAAPTNPLGALLGGLLGGEEDVGMIGIHLPAHLAAERGLPEFLELVPWRGEVEWSASPWGRWWLRARHAEHEAVVEAECDPGAGAVLRAPTMAKGLAPFCRDTFAGRVRLRVWRRRPLSSSSPPPPPLVDVVSCNGALEVGGGPWVGEWSARAAMREPYRSLVQLPIDVAAVRDALPEGLKPPGL